MNFHLELTFYLLLVYDEWMQLDCEAVSIVKLSFEVTYSIKSGRIDDTMWKRIEFFMHLDIENEIDHTVCPSTFHPILTQF